MKEWGLTAEEEDALDAKIFGESIDEKIPESWKRLVLSVPDSFYEIMMQTIEAYKKVLNTEKVFPALEAMVIEARNSLSQHDL